MLFNISMLSARAEIPWGMNLRWDLLAEASAHTFRATLNLIACHMDCWDTWDSLKDGQVISRQIYLYDNKAISEIAPGAEK